MGLEQKHLGAMRADWRTKFMIKLADIFLTPQIANRSFAVNAKIGPECSDYRRFIATIEQADCD